MKLKQFSTYKCTFLKSQNFWSATLENSVNIKEEQSLETQLECTIAIIFQNGRTR